MPSIEYQVSSSHKPDMDLTYEEVKRLAMELNSPELYSFVMTYEKGHCSWVEAMQMAAIHLAKETIRLRAELLLLISQRPPAPIIYKPID